MNQQYEYPPPPPQRSPGVNAPGSTSFLDRRPPAVQPPSLTTNIVRTLAGSSQTPISATSLGNGGPCSLSPNTTSPYHPRSPGTIVHTGSAGTSPRTATMEYNPRQWNNRGGQISGSQIVFQQRANAMPPSTQEVTGMEGAMPSPPPPYSPDPETPDPAGNGVRVFSPAVENIGFIASPLPAEGSSRNSPQVPMSPSFPPPPAQSSRFRDRSTSNQRGFFSLSGLRGKQPVTSGMELQQSNTVHVPEYVEARAPAARRAASTGHLSSSAAVVAAHLQTSETVRRGSPEQLWQSGTTLPGPPPGPPPPGTRSQSLNRYPTTSSSSNSVGSEHSLSGPQQRRAAAVSNLGPVPPTPADWVDPDLVQAQQDVPSLPRQDSIETVEPDYQPLRIDTGSYQDTALSRRHAKRDGSAQGLRERRSRSRAKDRGSRIFSPASDDSRPNEFVFAPVEGSISRRREHMRTISGYAEIPKGEESNSGSSGKLGSSSRATTSSVNNIMTPPYTPAVGKSSEDLSKTKPLKVPGSASSDRPISHLLHHPVEESTAMPAPLTPSRPASSGSAKTSTKLDAFLLQAMERHRMFIEKEAAATSDEDRLELFANFMVHESRLRRDRYSTAYNTMAGDIVDLTRDMWRSYTRQSRRAATPSTSMSSFDQTVPSWGSDGQPVSASSLGEYTPGTDAGSMFDSADGVTMDRQESRQWGEQFKPSLSPIPSMAVSTIPEEDSSRGRQPSRWWEASNSGSGSIGKPDRIQKSYRETKYMGVTAATLQDSDQPSSAHSWHTGSTPGPSNQQFAYGPDEYPPEKADWHEQGDFETPIPTPARTRKASTPGAHPLNVSRLVTLPPPYPRHHPAVNNSHPLLGDLRSEHRELADRARIQEIKDAYLDQDFAIQREQQEASKKRRADLRAGIQEKVADGTMSFAEAAQTEADFDIKEPAKGKANAKSNFQTFETSFAHPMNTLLTERLERADACIKQLRTELENHNQISDPNQAQEEGDEEPERLEKLTLLKWLFEAREQLHKEVFDLHADRSAKYSEVILTPYRIAKLQAKIDEATAFFNRDSHDRQMIFAKEALKRFEELKSIMELNVSRGVEDQLSAFWDIAPGLLEVIQHLPPNIAELEIQIPDQEYHENPTYNDHPLQYLYSLLSHTQKSAYQFIESQTNLLCLLHEVRTASSKSSLRLLEIERTASSPNGEVLMAEMQAARRLQEERLTEDLKEKVGEVERQWREALGEGLEECRERVRGFLEESDGWEEGLEE